MDEAAAFAERREQMLGLFAENVLALACDIQQEALAAESLDQKVAAAGALHKLGRALRQSLALHDKFLNERLKGERDVAAKAAEAKAQPREWKRARIRHAMERLVWDEHERDEDYEDGPGERLMEDLEDRLAALSGEPAFMDTPDEPLIAKLCEEFGFAVPAHIITALALVSAADAPRPNGPDSS